jgi:uncharacterized protein (TIGR02453 family)
MARKEVQHPTLFTGIPEEGLTFLTQLEKNNNREWFLKHKELFEQALLCPMRSLIASIRDILAPVAPSIRIDPIRSIHRIHRDVRFRRDKSPYKTHLAASFSETVRSRHSEGLYLVISTKSAASGGGAYMPLPAELRSIRERISDRGAMFKSIVEDPELKRRFGAMRGEQLQRAPRGFSPENAMLEYLRYKQFFFIRDYDAKACLRADFAGSVAEDYLSLLPFINWLSEATKATAVKSE